MSVPRDAIFAGAQALAAVDPDRSMITWEQARVVLEAAIATGTVKVVNDERLPASRMDDAWSRMDDAWADDMERRDKQEMSEREAAGEWPFKSKREDDA